MAFTCLSLGIPTDKQINYVNAMFCMNFVANLTTFVDTYILLRHPNPSVVIIGKTVDLDTMEINKQSWFYVNSYN